MTTPEDKAAEIVDQAMLASYDPADPLARIREAEKTEPAKRTQAIAKAVRIIAAAGMDAVAEAVVSEYLTDNKLLKPMAFRKIIKESRPPTPLKLAHTRTPPPDQPEQVCAPDGVCGAHPPLGKNADLLAEAIKAVHKLGVTGEERIIRGTFLAAVSQVLPEPVSVVVKGTSAGGKSYSTRGTLRLFPARDFYCVTAGSQRAMIFTDEEFRHRTIVMYEATALREVAEARDGDMTAMIVRTLLSEGQIIYDMTERGDDGRMSTRRIIKDGPTNLIVTTTADNLHHENETRLLSLQVDESEEQTRSVMQKIAARRNELVPADPPDLTGWHDLFHWLKHHGEHRVYIPYADYLSTSAAASVVRMRRDFGVLLGMIETHAVLHQLTRDRDDYGRIVATAADYEAARDILAEAFAITSGKKVKESVRRAVTAVDELGGEQADVTVAQVARHLKRDRTRVTRGLKEAADLGYLTNREDKQGRAARYRTGPDELPEDKSVLPDKLPDEVVGTRTPAQGAHLSAQVSGGCAPVRPVQGGSDDKVFHVIDDPPEPLPAPVPLGFQQPSSVAEAGLCTCGKPLEPLYEQLGWTHHSFCPAPDGQPCGCPECDTEVSQ